MSLLDVKNLRVSFATRGGEFVAVDGIDVSVDGDEVMAIVGESGDTDVVTGALDPAHALVTQGNYQLDDGAAVREDPAAKGAAP